MNALVQAPAAVAAVPAFPGDLVTPQPWRAGSGMICGGAHGQIIAATIRNPADLELFMAAPALLAVLLQLLRADTSAEWTDAAAAAHKVLARLRPHVQGEVGA